MIDYYLIYIFIWVGHVLTFFDIPGNQGPMTDLEDGNNRNSVIKR